MSDNHDDIDTEFWKAMNNAPEPLTTDSSPGEPQFEKMVTDGLEQYQDYLYGRGQYYGPAMDGSLRAAIRAALASGRLTPMTLYTQLGKPDPTDLRAAIEDCPAEQQQKLKKRVQGVRNDGR